MKRIVLLAVLSLGCSAPQRPTAKAPAPQQVTATQIRHALIGRQKEYVRTMLGQPTGTFSGGWKYQDKVWDPDLNRPTVLWVYFDDNDVVVKCE